MDLRTRLEVLLSPVKWRLAHWRRFRRWPNLARPRTFNEHVGAGMLLLRPSEWPHFSDKLAVKAFVAARLGPEWVTPTLWSGEHLPPRAERNWPIPYALKANNASGRNIFVKTEADADWDAIEAKLATWSRRPFSAGSGEWQYFEIPPRLLVEPLLPDPPHGPLDNYRFWCFDGVVRYAQLSTQRDGAWHTAFFHPDWTRAPFAYVWPIDPLDRERPPCLAAMLEGAARLAAGFPFARVDLYDIGGAPRFGEITFTPSAGLGRFFPPEADAEMGKLWPREA